MKKILLSLFMLIGTMSMASAATTTIWEGSEVAAWEKLIDINKNWADLNEGDVLTFTAETSAGAVFHLLDECWEKKVENIYFSEGVATVTITSAIIEKAVSAFGSIGVQGDFFTLTKVELTTADEPEPSRSFVDFELNFMNISQMPEKPESVVGWSGISLRGDAHGMNYGFQMQVAVDGPVKFTIGGCQYNKYSSSSNCIIKDKTGATLASLDVTTPGCYHNGGVATYIYIGGEDILTIVGAGYFPYIKAEAVEIPDVYINSKGLATFSVVHNLSIKTEGVKAYKAAVNGVTITLTELDGYIPAGTGVILRGEAGATVGFEAPASGATAADVTGNVLRATTKSDGTLETKPSSGNVYALNGDKFLEYTPDTFVANKAYIAVEGPAANELHIVFADAEQGNTTGIESIEAAAQTLTFDLNGRMATVRGLQIKNGKAVFVK